MFYHAGETYSNQTLVYNDSGNLANASTIEITIKDPDGAVKVDAGAMVNTATGTYKYDSYNIPAIPVFGTWTAEIKTSDSEGNYEIETETFYVVDRLYTTPQRVSGLMRLIDNTTQSRLVFNDSTDPSLAEVERFIMEAMGRIDRETNHAWRSTTVTYEYHDIPYNSYNFLRSQFVIHLKHRKINTLVSGTDKIEIWNGTEWEDLVLDANGYTEGRGNDYWLDYEQGVLYLVTRKAWSLEKGIRVSYRYGDSSVPADIEQACTKLVVIDIAENDNYVVQLPEGVDNYGVMSKVNSWKKDVERILYNHREIIGIC